MRRLLSGLVASRALAPSSKLAAAHWISQDVLIADLPARTDDTFNRTMDWLLEIRGQLERKVNPGPARAGNAPTMSASEPAKASNRGPPPPTRTDGRGSWRSRAALRSCPASSNGRRKSGDSRECGIREKGLLSEAIKS